jgi:hypothetical protein
MKPLFSSPAILFAGAFLLTLSLQSYPTNSQTSIKYVTPSEEPAVGAINQKAIKSFNRNYSTKAAVKWLDLGNMQEAYFVDNGKQNRVYYKPNGRWFRTLTSYDGSLLNSDIKSLVMHNFSNYEITTVTEVHEGIMHAYFVNIETAKDFKQVIVYEGEVWVHKQYRKQ